MPYIKKQKQQQITPQIRSVIFHISICLYKLLQKGLYWSSAKSLSTNSLLKEKT